MGRIDAAQQLSRLPAQPAAAMLLLQLVDDPETSPAELGRLVEMDPVLSARVMRLANAPHWGNRGAVRSASRAVVQLGSSTVRGIAAAAATSLLADDVQLGRPEHWVHAVAVAAGAAAASGVIGVSSSEAFSAGLLHDIGSVLLHRSDPVGHAAAVTRASRATVAGVLDLEERRVFGTTHADAGADALEEWQFPAAFVEAVRHHHSPVVHARSLTQAVILGEAVAAQVEPLQLGEVQPRLDATLIELGLSPDLGRGLVAEAAGRIGEIAAFLGGTP